MDSQALTSELKRKASELGFGLVGVCPAVSPPRLTRFHQWLADGYAGEMHYLPARAAAYRHPRAVLDRVRSIVMLGMHYRTAEPGAAAPGTGRVSRYAWGAGDYHDVLHRRLKELIERLGELDSRAVARGVVDTAPLLERDFAALAGLGWIGKNTLLLNKSVGSYFFLAALLTDLELVYDAPDESDHCGSCTACLDACPTDAFPEPYVLDATRCISYLTIELRRPIPFELRSGVGDWLFGCDVCQDVCPWNRKAPVSSEPAFQPLDESNPTALGHLFYLTDQEFRHRFRRTPLWRSKRRGLLRNAAIILGNQAQPESTAPLLRGLHDRESLVRGSCAWALGKLPGSTPREALRARQAIESDSEVLREIEAALG